MSTLEPRYPNLKFFKENLYHFESFDFKLITNFLLIFRDGADYCFCHKYRRNSNLSCPLCEIILHFWNYKDDLKKQQLDPVFLVCYRERLFPWIECFLMHEPSIACFAGPFFKIYDADGNVYQDFCLWFRYCIVILFLQKKKNYRKN